MPIYEYQCRACRHQFEALQKLSDAPLCDCPNCDQPELRKLVSAAAFKLKGSGWYETDFKNKNAQAGANGAGDDSGSAGKDAASPGAKDGNGKKETASESGKKAGEGAKASDKPQAAAVSKRSAGSTSPAPA